MDKTMVNKVNDLMIQAAKDHLNGELSDAKFYELIKLASAIYEVKVGA